MCYVYESHFENSISRKNYKQFIIARLARVYPLHVITLFTMLVSFLAIKLFDKFDVLSGLGKHIYRLDALPVQLTFLQTVGIYNFDTWNAPAWSLSAEWWAYILFPFLFLLFKKIGYKNWFLTGLIVIGGWFAIEFLLAPLEPFFTFGADPKHKTLDVNWHYGTVRGITGFIAGMVIWQLYKREVAKKILGNGWILLLLIVTSIISMYFKWYDSVTVSLFAIIIVSAAYGSIQVNAILQRKPLKKLGDWSFSIYIWHMIFLDFILHYFRFQEENPLKGLRPFKDSTLQNWGLLILFIAFMCVFANFSYRYIESPTRNWVKKKLQ